MHVSSSIGRGFAIDFQRCSFTSQLLNDSLQYPSNHQTISEVILITIQILVTASASGFTPLSISPTHVARVSLSNCVFNSCEISNRTNDIPVFNRVILSGIYQNHSLSSVCCAELRRSESREDIARRKVPCYCSQSRLPLWESFCFSPRQTPQTIFENSCLVLIV